MELNRIMITPDDEAHWLSLREQNLNSTDIAALFGCSPYQTAFELWHYKKGNLKPEFKPNERMTWGTRLESTVAEGIAIDNNWLAIPFKDYGCIPELRIGSSFDYVVSFNEINSINAILEIKCVDYFAYKDGWIVDGDDIEAPPHIELQVQHQMLVSGINKAYIGVLVGGNTVKILERDADTTIHALILKKAEAFWKSIDEDNPPEVDYSKDAETIIALNSRSREGAFIDATDDENIAQLIKWYHHKKQEIKIAESDADELKAKILCAIGDAEKVVCGNISLACGNTKDSVGTLVTPEMVGTYIGARKGYRMFKVNVKKGAK